MASIVILSDLLFHQLRAHAGAGIPGRCRCIAAGGYVGLIYYAARVPDLDLDDPDAVVRLPLVKDVIKTGLHYLPLFVLVWFLMVTPFARPVGRCGY